MEVHPTNQHQISGEDITEFGENGPPGSSYHFNYEEVESANYSFEKMKEEIREELMEEFSQFVIKLSRWVWQNASHNRDGLQHRASIFCWRINPDLEYMTLTHLAEGFGLDKQSIGRWHDSFKREFPNLKFIRIKQTNERTDTRKAPKAKAAGKVDS